MLDTPTATGWTQRGDPATSGAAAPAMVTVVNILAPRYSGATWLNLVLGGHSQGLSIGEMDVLEGMFPPVCKLHGEACPIWSRFHRDSDENPFVQLQRISGKRLLIVNNTHKYLACQKHDRVRSKYLLLVRDGRAVVASALRKHPQQSTWQAARAWARALRLSEQLARQQPAEDVLALRYESLQADLAGVLPAICRFLGVECEPGMLEFWNRPQHFLGGNFGALSTVARAQQIEPMQGPLKPGKVQNDLDFYAHSDPRRFVDERWKQELSDWQLRLFALAAGRMNRRQGYPRALDRG